MFDRWICPTNAACAQTRPRWLWKRLVFIGLWLVLSAVAFGQQPKIGLVLSGGGARGSAHLGVLKALEEMHIPIHVITGTSMGAIMGGLYASGVSIEEMESILSDTDWREILDDRPPRRLAPYRQKVDDQTFLTRFELGVNGSSIQMPSGLITGQKLNLVLQRLLIHSAGIEDFRQLPIPFAAIATDIETGDMVVLDGGDLGTAIRASMSIPGVFSPVSLDGKLLVDGGLARNLPVDVARAMGADIVIAVDVGEPLYKKEDLDSLSDIAKQMVSIPFRKNVETQLEQVNVLILPEIGDFKSSQFDKGSELVPIGEAATHTLADQLRPYQMDAEAFQQRLQRIRQVQPLLQRIESIQLTHGSTSDADRLFGRISLRPGDPFSLDAIEADLRRLYESGQYERVDYFLKKRPEGYVLLIEAHDKEWGPNYLRFGLNFESDFAGESTFNVLTSFNMTQLNQRRGKLKLRAQIGETPAVEGEFYQPLSKGDTWFAAVTARLETSNAFVAQGDGLYAPYRSDAAGGSIRLGAQLGRFGEVRVGPNFARVESTPDLGDGETVTLVANGLHVTAVLDQFDNMNFPTAGYFVFMDYFDAQPDWGSDVDYRHLLGFVGLAAGKGKHSLLSLTNVFSALDTDSPEIYNVGGLFTLSGYPRDSIAGRYGGTTALLYLFRFMQLPQAIGSGVFAGASLEAGNLWTDNDIDTGDLLYSGSVFVGIDTVLGPVYFANGFNDHGNNELYLYVGRTF
ncbi:MAG: patatin-like phospholipase family protein [Acidobacteria bacterium]|nr:patatin-like phospholipase family protein [Acidobacteriota bacterium]